MNLNSQFSFYPQQPDNPSDAERQALTYYALSLKGWPEDYGLIHSILSPPASVTTFADPGEFKGTRVGVIGGGLAGLAAAYELRKIGFDITVFDALQDRVGGRIYTYHFDRQRNLYHEFGPMRIPVSHEAVWHYIKMFNLPTRPFIQFNPYGYAYLRKVRVRNDSNGINVKNHIYPKYALNDWERSRSWQNLLSIGTDNNLLGAAPEERSETIRVKPAYNLKPLVWNGSTGIAMMESSGLSQDAISLVSNFMPLLYGNLYNSFIDYIQEAYPANLTYLYEIPGGMQRLPNAFYDSFRKPDPYPEITPGNTGNVDYMAGCYVNGIRYDSHNRKVSLFYRDMRTKINRESEFDYIICAIPFSTLRNVEIDPLFSNIKMRAIREVNYTPAQKSLLLCRERFWEKDGIVGGPSISDLPIASIWYPSDHAGYVNDPLKAANQLENLPWKTPGVIIGSFNFNLDTTRLTNQPADKTLAEIEREIEEVHGLRHRYLDNIVAGYKTVNWEQQPTFRGAISFYSPGQKRLFSYSMVQPEFDGRVFFAGEHISAVHRWMQGALQTGMQAANDLTLACRQHVKWSGSRC